MKTYTRKDTKPRSATKYIAYMCLVLMMGVFAACSDISDKKAKEVIKAWGEKRIGHLGYEIKDINIIEKQRLNVEQYNAFMVDQLSGMLYICDKLIELNTEEFELYLEDVRRQRDNKMEYQRLGYKDLADSAAARLERKAAEAHSVSIELDAKEKERGALASRIDSFRNVSAVSDKGSSYGTRLVAAITTIDPTRGPRNDTVIFIFPKKGGLQDFPYSK